MARQGKVINVDYSAHTIDVLLEQGCGIIYGVHVPTLGASTNGGMISLPVLKTVGNKAGTVLSYDGTTKQVPNVYKYESLSSNNPDLDDPTSNYVYAVIDKLDANLGQSSWVCLGFLFPQRSQMLFDPQNIPPGLPAPTTTQIKKLAGATISRTNSDVYSFTDVDGNYEWAHPNGSFFRLAETPTQPVDGAVHVDLSKGNRKSVMNGKPTNMAWNTQLKKGVDGNLNNSRKLYAQLEVVTAQGTVLIQIDKATGNVVINTPMDTSSASSANNQVKIIAGGNVILQSVAGDVTLQSVKGQLTAESNTTITVKTDSAKQNSIILGPNASQLDNLLLYKKVADKFNSHKHTCTGTGSPTTTPDQQITTTDATSITKAG
jgi:hypothetical protein